MRRPRARIMVGLQEPQDHRALVGQLLRKDSYLTLVDVEPGDARQERAD